MKILNIIIATFILMVFSSCESGERTGGVLLESETAETEETRDIDEDAIADRQEAAAENIESEINRLVVHLDSLRQRSQEASGEERTEIRSQLNHIERRINHLENQRANLEQIDFLVLEEVERALEDTVLIHSLDRNVRGEGTTLDGPDLNRTGTMTGTEIEKRQRVIEKDMETEHNVPSTIDD